MVCGPVHMQYGWRVNVTRLLHVDNRIHRRSHPRQSSFLSVTCIDLRPRLLDTNTHCDSENPLEKRDRFIAGVFSRAICIQI